jgi:hypothetical protein
MAPEFKGALIALVSTLLAVIVVEIIASRRRARDRREREIQRKHKERMDVFMPRYDRAVNFVDKINVEIFAIIESFNLALRVRNTDDQLFDESVDKIRKQLVNVRAQEDIDGLLSAVNAIGDEELISVAGDLKGVYNGLLGWIEEFDGNEGESIGFSWRDTQIIEAAKSDTLFYYRKFFAKLDELREGISELETKNTNNSE